MTTQQDRAELIRKLQAASNDILTGKAGIEASNVCMEAAALMEADAKGGEAVARVVKDGATVRLEWASADAAHNAKPGPLYAQPQAERMPLTDKQWLKMWTRETGERLKHGPQRDRLLWLFRFAEAAHHIGKPAPVGINGLTEAETAASASVMGLTRVESGPLWGCHGVMSGKDHG